MPFGGGMKLGGGAMILVVIVSLLFGVNPLQFLGMMDGGAPPPRPGAGAPDPGGAARLRSAGPGREGRRGPRQGAFRARAGRHRGRVDGALPGDGIALRAAQARPLPQVRSHRCAAGRARRPARSTVPADRKLYLDTAFFQELQNRFGAPGDFGQAYVIAHEVGHHVQNLMGTMREFDQASARLDERQRNALSVRLELQADCYAGVWGFYAAKRNLLEPGDAEEGLRAASAVGDDAIQKRTQGYVVPDGFTHGKAEQRMRWFKTGLASGDPRSCNTFAAKAL